MDNTYRPLDNVPLYLDHGLNQLVPVPYEDIKEEPRLVVTHPLSPQPPVVEQNSPQQLQQLSPQQQQLPIAAIPSACPPTSSLRSGGNRQNALEATGLSSVATIHTQFFTNEEQQQQQDQLQATPMILLPTEQSEQLVDESVAVVDDQMYMFRVIDEVEENISQNPIVRQLDPPEQQIADEQKRQQEQEEQQQQQFLPNNNAIILNIGGQQIILDAATFAHLLANPDANTPLITDDGTEFVLSRDILSALLIQQDTQNVDMSSGDGIIEVVSESELATATAHSGEYCPSNDILTAALPGPSVYGSDILQQTATATSILQASNDGITMMGTSTAINIANNNTALQQQQQQKQATPPIQAKVNETNALLNQTPIMSVLESPRNSALATVRGKID